MYSKEAFEAMTVVELRKVARENGVTLSAGISKQGIVERLCAALVKPEEDAAAEAEQPATPIIRRVASIVSDDDDTPVLTPNVPFNRSTMGGSAPLPPAARPAPRPAQPAPQASTPGQPTVNRGNIPGTNKPVFSLEGVRAWHNPRNYQQQNNSTFAQRPGAGFTQQHPAASPYGQQRTMQRPASTVSRFGPEAAQTDAPAPDAPAPGYRGDVRPQPQYAPQDQRPVYGQPAYNQPAYNQPAYGNDYRARTPMQPRDPAAPAGLPDMLSAGEVTDGSGILEIHPEGYGFLRVHNYLPGRGDIYVSNAQIRRFHLRNGDSITGKVRPQRENDRFGALLYITEINGIDPDDTAERPAFDALTATYPTKQLLLSKKNPQNGLLRTIDLLCPIGLGQRALIVAPPHSGKTELMQSIASAIRAQHPRMPLMTLLLGERPEDITAARAQLPGEVVAVGFDEPLDSQTRCAEMVLERAMRLAEQKKDVIVFIDNLTNLCRAYNESAPQAARMLPGGLAANALAKPRHLFGAARALREGGSLTIIAVLTADTGSPLDAAIADEFRGTANMELYLNADGTINLRRSLTRKADLMQSEDSQKAAAALRAAIAQDDLVQAQQRMADLLAQTEDFDALVTQLSHPSES